MVKFAERSPSWSSKPEEVLSKAPIVRLGTSPPTVDRECFFYLSCSLASLRQGCRLISFLWKELLVATNARSTNGFVLNQTMLRIKDPAISIPFYETVLGMTLIDQFRFSGHGIFALLLGMYR